MSIKSLLGGETNYKAIYRHYQKEYKKLVENYQRNKIRYENYFEWIEIVGPENFVAKMLEIGEKIDKNLIIQDLKEFFDCYPDAIPHEYNPYYVAPEVVQENSKDLEALKIEKEILEMKLKLKELENSK